MDWFAERQVQQVRLALPEALKAHQVAPQELEHQLPGGNLVLRLHLVPGSLVWLQVQVLIAASWLQVLQTLWGKRRNNNSQQSTQQALLQ